MVEFPRSQFPLSPKFEITPLPNPQNVPLTLTDLVYRSGLMPGETKPSGMTPVAQTNAASHIRGISPEMQMAAQVALKTAVQVGRGSGTLVGKTGNDYYILTNSHVAHRKGRQIDVTLPNGVTTKGTIVSSDLKSTSNNAEVGRDLAVVKVHSSEAFSIAKFAPNSPASGTPFLRVGFPDTAPQKSADLGGKIKGLYAAEGVLTTVLSDPIEGHYSMGVSAELGPGSSGGSTFNAKGEIAGINGQTTAGVITPPRTLSGKLFPKYDGKTQGYLISPAVARNYLKENKVPGF